MIHRSAIQLVLKLRTLCLLALLATCSAVQAFGFDDVAREAAALARQPYQAPADRGAALAALSYDDYRDIRFRPERSRWRDGGSLFQLQFFPLGRGTTRPLRLFELHDGQVRPLEVPASDFQVGRVARGVQPLPRRGGLAPELPAEPRRPPDELIVFLGASYFRAIGAGQVYGLSARGLAVDTAGGQGEEFPAFTDLLVRAAGPRRARVSLLRPARRPARQRRLPLRAAAGQRHGARRAGPPVPARAGGHARHRTADQHVPGRREPPVAHDYRPRCTTPTACSSPPATAR